MPHRPTLLLSLCACLVLGTTARAQAWTERAPIPTKRWNPSSVVAGGKLYVIGGQRDTSPHISLSVNEVYDPVSDEWTELAPMPTSRWGAMAAVAGDGRIYVAGGCTGTYPSFSSTAAMEVYDPVADAWTVLAPMPTHRGWGGAAALGDTFFVFGGWQIPGGATVTTVEKYPVASGVWDSDPDMPLARDTFVTATVGNCAYLISGYTDLEPVTRLVQEYDLETKVWTDKADVPTARYFAATAVRDGRVFVVGGRGGDGDECESFDPIADEWEVWGRTPIAREGIASGSIDGKVYVVAGSAPVPPGFPFYETNLEGSFETNGAPLSLPDRAPDVRLLRVLPNPTESGAQIQLTLGRAGPFSLVLYDAAGARIRRLASGEFTSGPHTLWWDGRDGDGRRLPSGCYFWSLEGAGIHEVRKVEICR